eukprot:6177398-Pleurochrysis_carterae.AAC.3
MLACSHARTLVHAHYGTRMRAHSRTLAHARSRTLARTLAGKHARKHVHKHAHPLVSLHARTRIQKAKCRRAPACERALLRVRTLSCEPCHVIDGCGMPACTCIRMRWCALSCGRPCHADTRVGGVPRVPAARARACRWARLAPRRRCAASRRGGSGAACASLAAYNRELLNEAARVDRLTRARACVYGVRVHVCICTFACAFLYARVCAFACLGCISPGETKRRAEMYQDKLAHSQMMTA